MSTIADSTNQLVKAGKQLSEMGGAVTGFGGKIGLVGQQINQAVVGAAAAIAAPSIALDDALAKVQSLDPISAAMATSVGRIRTEALGWQKEHTDGATQFVDTVYMMLSAGLDEAAAVEATKNAMLVAKATMGDSTQAANLLATAYNTMGNKAAPVTDEMTRIADVVTKTQQAFQIADLSQLGEGLKNARAGAILAGLDFNQLSATIGLLNSSGLQGAEAGTAFKDALNRMNDASTTLGFSVERTKDGQLDWIATMANLEQRVDQLGGKELPEVSARIREAFGDTGTQAIGMLLGKSQELAKGFESVSASAGVTAGAAKVIEEAGSGPLSRLTNNIELLKIGVADRLAPAFDALVPLAFQITDAIGRWIEQNPATVQLFADAVVELTAAGSGLAPVIADVVSTVTSWMNENPELVKGVFKVVLVAGMLFATLAPLIVGLGLTMSAAGQVFSGFGMLFGVTGRLIGGFVRFGGATMRVLQAMTGAPALIARLLPAFASAAAGAWSFTAALLANPITWIVLGIIAAAALIYVFWDDIVAFFLNIWTDIKAGFEQGFVVGIVNVLKYFSPLYWIARAMNAVTEWLFDFSLYDAGANILNTLVEGIGSMAGAAVNKVTGVVQSIRDLLPFSPAKAGPLRDLHKVRIIETVAESVSPDPLVAAVGGTMSQVQQSIDSPLVFEPQLMSAMPVTPEFSTTSSMLEFGTMPVDVMPRVAALPSFGTTPIMSTMPVAEPLPMARPLPLVPPSTGSSRGGSADVADGITIQGGLHFHIEGAADEGVEERLERWVRNNPAPIHSAVQREAKRQGRKGFGS
jgi:TP901 family phage tail tape measure protein